jgi:sodium transport system permease protein
MQWSNVKLILAREICDQLRDRRTMFMIVVLPVLLYPLLGVAILQVSQFRQEKPTRVLVIGSQNLPGEPRLIDDDRFAERLFSAPEKARSLELAFAAEEAKSDRQSSDRVQEAREAIHDGRYHAAVFFPPDFGKRLEASREAIRSGKVDAQVPQPVFLFSSASEKSQLTYLRLLDVWQRWRQELVRLTLRAANLPDTVTQPVELATVDVADQDGRRGTASWPRILPLLLMIWAMTGAFYPAVDLCAGEKERGTMETLLSSPAERSEIVVGKLLTIMLFSGITALLNIVSISAVGWMAMSRIPGFGPPPLASALWLLPALIPVSALFGAPCLALAAFARSTKEGQYYLMPLLMATMPLAVLPVASDMDLNLGSSLIPVTGMMLVLRSAMEGNYVAVAQFLPPVLLVTCGTSFLAIRWAIDQFNSESVLFRESERLNLTLWAKYLFRDRRATPRFGAAMLCAIVILLGRFLAGFLASTPESFAGLGISLLITQLVIVVAPVLFLTSALARSFRETLLLKWPKWQTLVVAGLLPVALNPVAGLLQRFVMWLYPASADVLRSVQAITALCQDVPLWQMVLLLALLPAICEELAFRGFILSGFRQSGHAWRAIVLSAVFFGLTHTILQQSLIATFVGVVIGFIAVRSNSILPPMIFHLVHNSMAVSIEKIAKLPVVGDLIHTTSETGVVYSPSAIAVGSALAVALLAWFVWTTRARPVIAATAANAAICTKAPC